MAPERRGQGLSRLVLGGLKDAAARAGLGTLVAPVRPTGKSAYPLTPMDRYVRWARSDGAPFDPWLRIHWRAGGELLGVCPASMEIAADVASWEAWTGLRFPRAARTWSRTPSSRWRSTASATSGATWSQMSGSGTGAGPTCRHNGM